MGVAVLDRTQGTKPTNYMEGEMNDYPPEYDEEKLDNQYFAEAFPDAKGLGDLYRQIYKYTACGPWLSARIQYIKVLEPDGYDEYPHEQEVEEWVLSDALEQEVEEWVHSDALYRLGSWSDMDSQGVLVTALMVGSIVEGCDHGTGEYEVEVKQLDEEPEQFAERFYKVVKEVNDEANFIWNDTHGCETCAKHWHNEGVLAHTYGSFEGCDGMTPVWKDCPGCSGSGVVV